MGRQTEQTDKDGTLPHPELNPLVNPLLGENMGRWAEVYFTAAPEHREEAVQALLQELRNGGTDKPAYSASDVIAREPKFAEHGPAERPVPSLAGRPRILPGLDEPEKISTARVEEKFVTCESCGARAPDVQKFCGMCGAPMQGDASTDAASGPEVVAAVPPKWAAQNRTDRLEEYYPVDIDRVRDTVFSFGGNVPASDRSIPYRYRIYVGAALLILIAALAFMGYRSSQSWPGSSHSLPQAAPNADSQPTPQTTAKTETSDKAPVGDDGRAAAPSDGDIMAKPEPHKNSAPTVKASQPPPASAPAPPSMTPDPPSATQGNGSQELLIAERYLNGAPGNARDSREAARWLWQAVGKQNAAATVMLSDLYLRGDGVPKNCDQARLLLDAAASKGAAGAGDRLRNLQAFGCQ